MCVCVLNFGDLQASPSPINSPEPYPVIFLGVGGGGGEGKGEAMGGIHSEVSEVDSTFSVT